MEHASIKSYIWGFILSIAATVAAYALTEVHINSAHEVISHEVLLPAILLLALFQLVVQLVFFLHLGKEKGPRWQLAIFISTIGLIFLVVGGSLWIMGNLSYMTPDQMNTFIQNNKAAGF